MNSHELAALLLSLPALPVSTHANNHTALNDDVKVGLLDSYKGSSIIIGNFSRLNLNGSNERVTRVLSGHKVPKDWS